MGCLERRARGRGSETQGQISKLGLEVELRILRGQSRFPGIECRIPEMEFEILAVHLWGTE
jgi:hypothetical protein